VREECKEWGQVLQKKKAQQAVETTRALLQDGAFSARHRNSPTAFTRVRSLPLALVVALILRKGVKSLQNWVNEAIGSWAARR
jgi:hypothetical protein